jgi:ATP-dependent DNA helicase DinG
MSNTFLSNFPKGYSPSKQQSKLLKHIEAAFEKNKFVICCAPTGSGKSFISKTLSNVSQECSSSFKAMVESYDAFKMDQTGGFAYEQECINESPAGSFALTITKTLQDQYKSLFDDTQIIKGKSNYKSTLDPTIDVELESIVMPKKVLDEHRQNHKCNYHNDRNSALVSNFSALNYKMFLSLPGHVKYKNYIICDEASELEDEIIKQFSILIDIQKLRKFNVKIFPLSSTKTETVRKWVDEILTTVSEHIGNIHDKSRSGLTQSETTKLRYLKNTHRTLSLISETWSKCEYIVQIEDKFNIKVTPLKVDTLTKYIFKYAEKVLLMSATIIDHKNLAKTLGIKNYEYVESSSTFDPAKAPIYISKTNKLNHTNLQKALPAVIEQIKAICTKHKDEKGIIHTHTNLITSYIKNNISSNRLLFRDELSTNEDILEAHEQTKEPTILVSPSLGLGIDLKGDLARFQIIVKAAYLPLGDNRIKKMFEQDKQWYQNKMLSNFIQQCGRGIRSKDDHCVTYVLDATIFNAVIRSKSMLPKYFLDRFV